MFKKRVKHLKARITRGYYYEDYKRVYPDGIAFAADGTRKDATEDSINNFLNHRKFYLFASQFVGEKRVADVGCGSGYGCQILKEKGASGFMASTHQKRASIMQDPLTAVLPNSACSPSPG